MLPEIALGPTPTEEDLRPFMRRAGEADAVRMLAEIEWQMDLQARDPNAFLVPFTNVAFPALGFRTYDAYRASPLWTRIKREELRKAGGRCRACAAITRTIHHRDYRLRVLSGEDRSPLVALCQPCHEFVHFAPGRHERAWNDSERVLHEMIERGGRAPAVVL